MKTNGRNITKNINGYKVELFERRPATRVAYPAYCGECIDATYRASWNYRRKTPQDARADTADAICLYGIAPPPVSRDGEIIF